jgi:hypothetical protein
MSCELPMELQRYILDFVRPYVTRSDWKTCRQRESDGIKKLTRLILPGHMLHNGSRHVRSNALFYELLLYGRVAKKEERNAIFPRKHLRITLWSLI